MHVMSCNLLFILIVQPPVGGRCKYTTQWDSRKETMQFRRAAPWVPIEEHIQYSLLFTVAQISFLPAYWPLQLKGFQEIQGLF